MNCVPLSKAKPSLDASSTGCQPCLARTSEAGRFSPFTQTSPKPIKGKHICANGAKSPDAPNEPCW